MKIFSAQQIRQWDATTIEEQGIHSIELMERAAKMCTDEILSLYPSNSFVICAGPGNNGGDGLAIARLLRKSGREVNVFHVITGELSPECSANREKLRPFGIDYREVRSSNDLPGLIAHDTVIIDCLLGTGQNRPLDGLLRETVETINRQAAPVVAIDIPTGLIADGTPSGSTVIRARYTLSFQCPKIAFLLPENEEIVGEWRVLDIGLSTLFEKTSDTVFEMTGREDIRSMVRPRKRFSHKGTYGTAMLVAGSPGMMGAAMLAAKACLRSGVGKLICSIPPEGLNALLSFVPEAIANPSWNNGDLEGITALGLGPGIGKTADVRAKVKDLLAYRNTHGTPLPLVIDADALNIIGEEQLQDLVPVGSILTPHPLEFQRMYGQCASQLDRIQLAREIARRQGIYIILKGHYSFLASPTGMGYFNTTGNPGLAKAGTGDVLTGMITALVAQGYSPEQACRMGLYLHGLAADLAADRSSQYSITATDVIDCIGPAYRSILPTNA